MERRGLGTDADPSDADPLASAQPTLAGLAADSVRGFAPGGGRPARRGDRIDPEDLSAPATPRCAATMGFTLHANVAVPARDRHRLERLCRYVARPPVATDRLERLPDGRLLYHLRHRWRDGTTQMCSSRTNSSADWYPSSRPLARTRSAITECLPPAPAGATAWSQRDLTRASPRGPRAAGTLRTRRLTTALTPDTAPIPRPATPRRH